jgi:hypothetical protein
MRFAQLEYDVVPGGASEAVLHVPAVIVIVALLLKGDTPEPERPKPPEAPAEQPANP